jgi:Domain of unknown function (DUF4349)
MTASPDLLRELRASRPVAPTALRARIRETARAEPSPTPWARFRLPARRVAVVALPAAAAIALATAGVLGLARSDVAPETQREQATLADTVGPEAAPGLGTTTTQDSTIGPTPGRAQRVSATLTVEVADAEAVSAAAQDTLDLVRSLGGHVVNASVSTGDQGTASLTVRVPVGKVQEAIAELSALGRIVSQHVTIDDLQESLDELQRREANLRARLAKLRARLATETLDAQTEAVLRSRLQSLRTELQELREGIAATNVEARMSTIQLTVVTPESQGVAPAPSRLDRAIDEALGVLAWEGVLLLAAAIVAAPFALLVLAAWLGRRLYRRREDERLLAS